MPPFFSSRCILELKFAIYNRAAGLSSQAFLLDVSSIGWRIIDQALFKDWVNNGWRRLSQSPYTPTIFLIQQVSGNTECKNILRPALWVWCLPSAGLVELQQTLAVWLQVAWPAFFNHNILHNNYHPFPHHWSWCWHWGIHFGTPPARRPLLQMREGSPLLLIWYLPHLVSLSSVLAPASHWKHPSAVAVVAAAVWSLVSLSRCISAWC